MKANDFTVAVSATIDTLNARLIDAKATQASVQASASKEEKEEKRLAVKAIETKIAYVNRLTSEKCANKCASFVKDASVLSAIVSNSYSLDKFALICSAITIKSKSILSEDSALMQAVSYLVATDFKTLTHDTLRKNLFSKSDASKCHATTTQANQFCSLLERLQAAERVKLDDKAATAFKADSALVRALNALFD